MTVEVDAADWAELYGLSVGEVRDDVRVSITSLADDWLSQQRFGKVLRGA